jgi:hypothetical protein
MNMRVSTVLVALAVVGLVAGCSESPTAKYEAGKATIEEARLNGMEQYAPALYKEASDSLNAAVVEMQKQDSRFSVFRSYGKADEIIVVAQQLAEKAGVEAAAEKERMHFADSALIAEIDSLITATRSTLAEAPRGKGSRIDLKVMQSDIDAAAGALAAATEEYRSGSYLTANEKLQAVKAQVVKVKTDIDSAIARLTKK